MNVVELVSGQAVGTDHTTPAGAAAHLRRRSPGAARRPASRTGIPEVIFIQGFPESPSETDSALTTFMSVGPDVQVVVSLSQRDLFRSPGTALEFRDRVRARGWALAVSNVGTDPASLAMLPLIEPEVISLDAAVIRRQRADAEKIATIAVDWARKWGALVVAEGVRTPADRDFALTVGAQLGYGPLWSTALRGQSRAGTDVLAPWITMLSDWAIGTGGPTSPAQLLDRHPDAMVGDLVTVLAHSHAIETRAFECSGPSSVLLAAFQHRRRLGRESKQRFIDLASSISFVGVLGVDMPAEPLPAVRGVCLDAGEPAALEWNVVTISPGYEAALISRETTPSSTGARRFEYLVSDDSATVRHAARIMLRRFRTDPAGTTQQG